MTPIQIKYCILQIITKAQLYPWILNWQQHIYRCRCVERGTCPLNNFIPSAWESLMYSSRQFSWIRYRFEHRKC